MLVMPVILVWIYTDQKLEVILIFKCDFLFRDKSIPLQVINQLLNLHRDSHSKQSVLFNCFEIKRGVTWACSLYGTNFSASIECPYILLGLLACFDLFGWGPKI